MDEDKCGRKGPSHPATKEIQGYCDQVKPQVEQTLRMTFSVYEAKTYVKQIVAGTEYFVTVYVGNDDYIALTIWKKLDNTIKLTKAEFLLKEGDDL